MKAIDLIIKLQQLPPNMEVKIDVPNMAGIFKFADILEVERISIESHDDIIMLSPYEMDLPETN